MAGSAATKMAAGSASSRIGHGAVAGAEPHAGLPQPPPPAHRRDGIRPVTSYKYMTLAYPSASTLAVSVVKGFGAHDLLLGGFPDSWQR